MSNCRIVDVGGCAWEGASRFVKFVNNYVRNAGTVAIGNISSREADFEVLPRGSISCRAMSSRAWCLRRLRDSDGVGLHAGRHQQQPLRELRLGGD